MKLFRHVWDTSGDDDDEDDDQKDDDDDSSNHQKYWKLEFHFNTFDLSQRIKWNYMSIDEDDDHGNDDHSDDDDSENSLKWEQKGTTLEYNFSFCYY